MNSMLKTTINVNHSCKVIIAVWILTTVFCSLCLYLKANTEIQHGPKYKLHILGECK